MIEISIKTVPVTDSASTQLTYLGQCILQEEEQVFNFCEECVNQNLVLNIIAEGENPEFDTLLFSPTMENAQEFARRYSDLSTEFSLKKFWNNWGIDSSVVSMREIDNFDSTDYNSKELVNRNPKTIFGEFFVF
jgi:hypothetical protein